MQAPGISNNCVDFDVTRESIPGPFFHSREFGNSKNWFSGFPGRLGTAIKTQRRSWNGATDADARLPMAVLSSHTVRWRQLLVYETCHTLWLMASPAHYNAQPSISVYRLILMHSDVSLAVALATQWEGEKCPGDSRLMSDHGPRPS